MKSRIKISLSLIVTLIFGVCSGCSISSKVGLDSSAWVLTAIDSDTAFIGNTPTLEFEGDQVVGNASCNTYSGSYQIKGETISFGPLARTEMYCMEPEGVMDQEQTYLEILGAARRFELDDDTLTIYSDSGKTLTFQSQNSMNVATGSPSAEPSKQEPPTITPEPVDPAPVPDFDPPSGFKEYQDTVAGVSIYIPKNWTVTGVANGEYAIFQSYPEDKYVGGEGREPGDTKCDLSIRPTGTRVEELVQQWQADSMTTIVSKDEFILYSGLKGERFVVDSMGRFTVYITELNRRVVLLTCFGDFALVDEIAITLMASE